MPIKYGSKVVNDVFYGNKRVLQIYQGSKLVYNAEIRLPKEYVELEYIESTGTQYITLPYIVNNNTSVFCRYLQTANGDEAASVIFGVTSSPDSSRANNGCMRLVSGTNPFDRIGWGSNTSGSVISINGYNNLNQWYDVFYDLNKLYIDNTLVATSSTPTSEVWQAKYYLGLFARTGSSVTMKSKARISSFWAKENGKYVLNLIPAMRNRDGEIGLYDIVTKQFFTNAGTGVFIAGNFVLPKGYDELEYIESTGTQYIDTLYKPNNNTKFYINYNITKNLTEYVTNVPYGVTNITPTVDKAGNGLFRTTNGGGRYNRVAWGDTTTGSNSGDSLGNNHTIVYGNWCEDYYDQNEIYIDNDLVYTSTTNPLTVWNSTNNLYIFARNNQGKVDFNSAMRLKLAYATENNLYKMYLKPARKISDGSIGMYDLINNKFLTNVGSGEFIIPTN